MEEDLTIKKVSASELVCESIQNQIKSGAWKVGDRLPSEADLARRFGVNRLTVRMALQKLNAMGVVETRTGSGTYVIEFDFESYLSAASRFYEKTGLMRDVCEFRDHMEVECARLAIERATDEDIKKLESLALAHREAYSRHETMDHEDWCRLVANADLAFHEQVCRMSHNTLYINAFAVAREPTYEYILFNVSKWDKAHVEKFSMDKRRDVHYNIYTSIRNKDFDACKKDYESMLTSYTSDVDGSMPEIR